MTIFNREDARTVLPQLEKQLKTEATNISNLTEEVNAINETLTRAFLVGEIRMYSATVAPKGWLLCDGSAVSRLNYPDLYKVIGTTYGGNGNPNFNLPDLCGRFPVGKGSLKVNTTSYWGSVTAGQVNCPMGEKGGEAWHTLTADQLPPHNHTILCGYGDIGSPTVDTDAFRYQHWGGNNRGWWNYFIGGGGSGNSHNNMPPYAVVTYIICAY